MNKPTRLDSVGICPHCLEAHLECNCEASSVALDLAMEIREATLNNGSLNAFGYRAECTPEQYAHFSTRATTEQASNCDMKEDILVNPDEEHDGSDAASDVPELHPFPDYLDEDDVMPIDVMATAVSGGWFIDYDGHGYYATEDGESNQSFSPSSFNPPKWATHVSWYNR